MTMFQSYPTFERFRPISDKTPMMMGVDVYALQTALAGAGHPVGPFDGYCGPATGKAIWGFQTAQGLFRDGIAGPATNNRLVEVLCAPQTSARHLPEGLLFGQLAWESSLYPGQYSPQRPDGSYDAGVAQRNTAHTPAVDGFNTPVSIAALATNERKYFDKFAGVPGRRRWLLAAGAWNAPAFACYLANEEGASVPKRETLRPTAAQRVTFSEYMLAATVLM